MFSKTSQAGSLRRPFDVGLGKIANPGKRFGGRFGFRAQVERVSAAFWR
ncbi:MAG: hypothetical protein IJE97_08750 [Thermoguttaceae bacterium]|nr:hypothetical protein [Thermoguttaceae bacterium]MBQ7112151.1 hypothetical protein [Thermoguttaceae bacterium]